MGWVVNLDPINSGEVCKIEITNIFNTITLEDVMFGDVWFCSGQSNMGWAMKGKSQRKYLHRGRSKITLA